MCTAILVGLSLCLTGVANSKATAIPSPEAPKKLCEQIVDQASRGERKGFDLIVGNLACGPTSSLDKELVITHTREEVGKALNVLEKYGKYLGYELAEEHSLGASLRKCIYMAKFERGAMRWTFICYRPRDTWRIVGVTYRDVANDLVR
jgi:hypothetical protein